MGSPACSIADHQVGSMVAISESLETPPKQMTPDKVRDLSSTPLNFVMTPTQLRASLTSMDTFSDSTEMKGNDDDNNNNETGDGAITRPIQFASPRISSPVEDNQIMFPPMTPKTYGDEMFLSPAPNLFSPKVNRRRHQSLPQPISTTNSQGNPMCSSVEDEDLLPCREISKGLKTRLNYALMNLQNGWFEKSLPNLEDPVYKQRKHTRDLDNDDDDDSDSDDEYHDNNTMTSFGLSHSNEKRIRRAPN